MLQPTEIQTLCRQGKIEKKYCYDQKNNSENPENSIQQQSDTKVFYFKIQKNHAKMNYTGFLKMDK